MYDYIKDLKFPMPNPKFEEIKTELKEDVKSLNIKLPILNLTWRSSKAKDINILMSVLDTILLQEFNILKLFEGLDE